MSKEFEENNQMQQLKRNKFEFILKNIENIKEKFRYEWKNNRT
jgi:hypothetical protein